MEPGQLFRFQAQEIQRVELHLSTWERTIKKVSLESPEQIGSVVKELNDFRYRKSNFINLLDPQASSETPSYQISVLSIELVFAADEFTCWITPYENGELTHLRRRYIGDTSNLLSLCHKLLESSENNMEGGNAG